MNVDLKKFEEKRKTSLANTIGSTFWLGIEDLSRTISGAKKSNGEGQSGNKNQISRELDKYENVKIGKSIKM